MKAPKHKKLFLFLFSCFAFASLRSQVSFTLAPSLCEGAVVSASMNTGTMSAFAYSWAAIPASGVIFSSSSTQTTDISFPIAGTYTVGAGILTGSGYSYTTNVIVINPSPTISVNPTNTLICFGNSAALQATGTGTSFAWTPAGSLFGSATSNPIASPLSTTIYTVVNSLGVCTASAAVTVSVAPIPTLGISSTASSVCPGFTSTLTAFGASGYTWTSATFTAPVYQQSVEVGPGTYTLTGGAGACLSATTTVVGSSPPLQINVTQSSPTTCIAGNFPKFSKVVHLTATGASIYVWFPYNPSFPPTPGASTIDVRPTATTCYTVTGSTAVCSGSAVVCITVVPQFTAAVTPASVTMCSGDHVPLSVGNIGANAAGPSSAFTYVWTEALNAPPVSLDSYFTPTVNIFPQNSTTYTLEVWDAANCISDPVLVNASVNACVGIDKYASNATDLRIFPNPAKDKLFIQSLTYSSATIEVLDALGKVLIKESRSFSEGSTAYLNVAILPAGMYFVRVSQEGLSQKVLRMIKQ